MLILKTNWIEIIGAPLFKENTLQELAYAAKCGEHTSWVKGERIVRFGLITKLRAS